MFCKRIIFLFIFFNFLTSSSYAYILNKTSKGSNIKWTTNRSSIDFHLNANNSNSLDTATVNSIMSASTDQWDVYLDTTLRLFTSSTGNISGRNDIIFASQDSFFNDPGIIGVTQLVFDIDTGAIVETDIILNDLAFGLSTNQGDEYYLGDVLAHEMGHALGLSHSQVLGATMFYRLRSGQATIEQDDISGLGALYGANDPGVIQGKIVGGEGLERIFGSRVSAISENTGDVMASTISNEDGSYFLSGLPINDTYFLYIHPLEALGTLPSYFNERKLDFCQSGASYRGSFFQGCDGSNIGHPYGIYLKESSSLFNTGNITIRCSFPVASEYLINKSGGTTNLSIDKISGSNISIGDALTGYFSTSEIINNKSDFFDIDLSHLDLSSWTTGEEYFLETKILSQKLFSKVKIGLEVELPSGIIYKEPANNNSLYLDSDLNPIIDLVSRVPINLVTNSENKFQIKVTPYDIDLFASANSMSLNRFFPSSTDFLDDEAFYFMSIRIVKKVVTLNQADSYILVTHRQYNSIVDNTSCPDAAETYSVKAGGYQVRAEDNVIRKRKEGAGLPIACGSIGYPDGDDGDGRTNLALSFIFCLVCALLISNFKVV